MKYFINNVEYKELSKNVIDFATQNGFFIYESDKAIEFNDDYECLTVFDNSEIKLIDNTDYLALVKAKCENVEVIKKALELEIESAFKTAMSSIDKTPSEERLTFERQEREARAYQESKNEIDAPFVKTLAGQRGVEFEFLVSKIIEKADKYALASAVLIGKRQKCLDEIKKATTKEDLNSINVEFSL